MQSETYIYEYDSSYIDSIRQDLQIIKNVLLDGDEFSRTRSNSCLSKTNLLKALDHLEKEKNQLPRSYGEDIDFLLREVRQTLCYG